MEITIHEEDLKELIAFAVMLHYLECCLDGIKIIKEGLKNGHQEQD